MKGHRGTFPTAGRAKGRLDGGRLLAGWRQIADHFGRDERTVKRWAAGRAMPVHRLPGDRRSIVYADPDELDAWLKSTGAPAGGDAAPRPWRLAAFAAAVALAVAGYAGWRLASPGQPQAGAAQAADPRAQELYHQGVYLWERRTPESLRRAEQLFRDAAAIDPGYARAHVGLAKTYNLMREFSVMPARQAYAAAAEEARLAIALDPADVEAQIALAFAEFYGLRQLGSGIARFERARALDADAATIRHWYANALLHLGRFDEALAEIGEAQRLDPASRAIVASKGLALFCAGRAEEAVALLEQLAALEPDFLSPRTYLTYIRLAEGAWPAWLETLRVAGTLRGDLSRVAVAEAGMAGLAEGGFDGMVAAMLAEERRLHAEGRTIIYNVARMEALAGDREAALATLRASLAADEEYVMMLNIDPAFRQLRADAEFQAFAASFGLRIVQ